MAEEKTTKSEPQKAPYVTPQNPHAQGRSVVCLVSHKI
jgi:hypothetical protein